MNKWKEYLNYNLICVERCRDFIETPVAKELAKKIKLSNNLRKEEIIVLLDYVSYKFAAERFKKTLLENLSEEEIEQFVEEIMPQEDVDYQAFQGAIWIKKYNLIKEIITKNEEENK